MLQKLLISPHSKVHNGFLNYVSYKLIDITYGFDHKKENLKEFLNRHSATLIFKHIVLTF